MKKYGVEYYMELAKIKQKTDDLDKEKVDKDEFKKLREVVQDTRIDVREMKALLPAAKELAEKSVKASEDNHDTLRDMDKRYTDRFNTIDASIRTLIINVDGDPSIHASSMKLEHNEMREVFQPSREMWVELGKLTPAQAKILVSIDQEQLAGIADIDKDGWPVVKRIIQQYSAVALLGVAVGVNSLIGAITLYLLLKDIFQW